MQKYGRHPDDIKIMPGFFVTVANTTQEAKEKFEQLQELIHPEAGLILLSNYLGINLSDCDPDQPVPELPVNTTISSRAHLLVDIARREKLTIRKLYQRVAGARGHQQIFGTPAEVVDKLEEWFTHGGADGFNIMPPVLPSGLEDFVSLVVPELQRRGLYRTAYEGKTLRENMGLKMPVNRYAAERSRDLRVPAE
jgi:alkanesulfonate monooxygenase